MYENLSKVVETRVSSFPGLPSLLNTLGYGGAVVAAKHPSPMHLNSLAITFADGRKLFFKDRPPDAAEKTKTAIDQIIRVALRELNFTLPQTIYDQNNANQESDSTPDEGHNYIVTEFIEGKTIVQSEQLAREDITKICFQLGKWTALNFFFGVNDAHTRNFLISPEHDLIQIDFYEILDRGAANADTFIAIDQSTNRILATLLQVQNVPDEERNQFHRSFLSGLSDAVSSISSNAATI